MDYTPLREYLFSKWDRDEKGHGLFEFKDEFLTGKTFMAEDAEGQFSIPVKEHIPDADLAKRLNEPAGLTIRKEAVPRDAVAGLAIYVRYALKLASAEAQAFWSDLISDAIALLPSSAPMLSRASLQIMDALVADNVITEEKSWEPWTVNNASVAESLYGVGTILTEQDIGHARNGE